MEISSVNFMIIFRPNQEHCQKCNYILTPWQESNLRPCDSGVAPGMDLLQGGGGGGGCAIFMIQQKRQNEIQ